MTKDVFRKKVFELLHEEGYAPHKSDEELEEALDEYDDILTDGYEMISEEENEADGLRHGIDYAAWNIAMCI